MAQKVIVSFVDDLDGKELDRDQAETFKFGIGSERYELDVSHQNAEKLRTVFGEYVSKARNVTRVGGTRGRSTGRSSSGGGSRNTEAAAIREWAEKMGLIEPGQRGRIPNEVKEKYEARHGQQQSLPAQKTQESQPTSKPPVNATTTPKKDAPKTDKAKAPATA